MTADKRLNILFTNNTLDIRGGSEMVILDLAREFRRRGHFPVAFSMKLGGIEKELKEACIPVVSNLDALGNVPDIIHGQHHLEAMAAMTYFHNTPAIYVCHGWFPWPEVPPVFCNIKKYVAVGELTREYISTTCAVRREDVEIIPNFVDLSKFLVKEKINVAPLSAAIFGNGVGKNSNFVEVVAAACMKTGLKRLDVFGHQSGNPISNPEEVLRNYDVVFSVGRCAIEAMSMGCAVIISDDSGVAELVRPDNMERMFGKSGASSLLKSNLNVDYICGEILKFNAQEVRQVTDWIRAKVGLCSAADRYENIYREAISIQRADSMGADGRGFSCRGDRRFKDVAKYLSSISANIKSVEMDRYRMSKLVAELQPKKN